MKRIPVISLILLILNTGLLIYLVCKTYLLPEPNKPQQLISGQNKLLSDPLEDDTQAQSFVKAFQEALGSDGLISWPKDTGGRFIKSWEIEFDNLNKILDALRKEQGNALTKHLRIYPIMKKNEKTNKMEFSIMVVGQYRKAGKKYLLRKMKDPSDSTKEIAAPMYEWLEPCPPFDCPENDF